MEIIQLRYLEALIKLKSFKKAAAENYVSTSTLSRQVSAMEEELGFPLFERSAQGITLTEQGAVFYRQTRKILSIYESAVLNARNVSDHRQIIRVEIFSYNRNSITRACEAIQNIDNSIQFSFVSCRLTESCSALLNYRLDVSLLTDIEGVDEERFFVVPIYYARQAMIIPDSHPLAEMRHIRLEDLDGETILIAGHTAERHRHPSMTELYHMNCPNSTLIPFQHPHQADALSQMNRYMISSLSILEPSDGFRFLLVDDAPMVKIGAMCRREDQPKYQSLMEQCRDYFLRHADEEKTERLT